MDYDTLRQAGSMLGSAAVIVIDDATDIVEVIARTVEFYREESCGKCTPCREGTIWITHVFDRLLHGRGRMEGLTLLESIAAGSAGIEIPIFCYHDRMPPLGACRMCLVRVEKLPKLQTSCTLVATDGMVVDPTSAEVRTGQEAILEFLLINHPLDCPICDKGGECPLQDQTFTFGPGRR